MALTDCNNMYGFELYYVVLYFKTQLNSFSVIPLECNKLVYNLNTTKVLTKNLCKIESSDYDQKVETIVAFNLFLLPT